MVGNSRKKNSSLYQPQPWETKGDTKRWIRLYDDMIKSPAFLSLSPYAKLLYIYIKGKHKGVYNEIKDTVIFPYTQAAQFTGIRKGNIKKLIDELENFGFIKTSQVGGLYRVTNHYTLINGWHDIDDKEAEVIKKRLKDNNAAKSTLPKGLPDG